MAEFSQKQAEELFNQLINTTGFRNKAIRYITLLNTGAISEVSFYAEMKTLRLEYHRGVGVALSTGKLVSVMLYNYYNGDSSSLTSTEVITSPTKENIMKASNVISTQINVFGSNAESLTEDQLFSYLGSVDTEIKRLKDCTTKPKKLEARIKDMEAARDALVEHIDSRD